jgi:bifunctional non-homologous end joining protein LigD
LFTCRGHDWTDRYPAIVVAAAKLGAVLTLDGEAVMCDGDGVAVFAALHRRQRASDPFLYAFDLFGASCAPDLSASARRGWRNGHRLASH